MTFIGRQTELQFLEDHYQSSKGELLILYGRRRVGKTELLNQFCDHKPHVIYYTATQSESLDNLTQFTEMCQSSSADPMLNTLSFKNLEGVLTYLAPQERSEKLVIVLDEFQYWVQGDASIPSLIQRFWDEKGRHSNIMLVLCGSYMSLMIDYTLAEKSPLYGRRTGQLQVKPFDYRTAAQFFPEWSHQDHLIAYGILGGIPAYLNQFDSSQSLETNIITKLLHKGTFLSEEAGFLLKTELRDTKTYSSLLKAIAAGNTTLKDLSSKMMMDGRTLSPYLSTLQELHHIQREVSMSERAPEKSRKGRYRILDNYLHFWFRFVEPYVTLLERNEGEQLYRNRIEPQLSTYMGGIFETVCQQYVQLYGKEIGLPVANRVGRIWDKDFDIDVVAENLDDSYTFGECKWSSTPINPHGIYTLLKERAEQTQLSSNPHYTLFASNGFTDSSDLPKGTSCVTLDTLFNS